MKTTPDLTHLNRREFLRLAGVATSGLLAGALLPPGAAHASQPGGQTSLSSRPGLGSLLGVGSPPGLGASGRIGVLLPASTIYPNLGRNFLAGLQLAAEGRPWDMVVRETGTGATSSYAVTQQLLTREGVQGIIGMIDPLSIAFLRGALQAHQATLLAVSLGENLLRVDKADTRVTYHSLDLAPTAVAFGAWAARALGRTAVLATSCYDSGYDTFAAFRLGFENAGGQVRHTVTTHLPTGGPNLAGVMRDIATARPDFVYAAYCGPGAVDWVSAYKAAGLAGAIPLAGSPFLTDEALLPTLGAAALGILTASPAPSGDQAAALAFADAYQARTGRPADLLALLGYETARLLTGQPVGSRTIALRTVQRQAGGLVNTIRQTLDAPGASNAAWATLRQEPHSGWLYPYLGV